MSFFTKVLRDSVTGPVLDKVGDYIEQNGLTQRAIEKTKQVSELVSSTWRPAIAHSIRKGVVFCLAFTAFMVLFCLIALSMGAEWVKFDENSALNALWARWEALVFKFFEFGLYFLGIYAGLREVGKTRTGEESLATKAIRRITEPKVKREPMDTEVQEEIQPIPGVNKRRRPRRRISSKLDADKLQAFNKGYEWGPRSIRRMTTPINGISVHDDIIHLLTVALEEFSEFDVGIAHKGGMRDLEEQADLFASGASQTMNSRHLHGMALDIICYDEDGKYTKEWKYYELFYKAVCKASKKTGIPFQWGGHWGSKDGPHYQLPRSQYPDVLDVDL